MLNSEFKLIIFEEKKELQNLLDLLDEQYNLILNNDVMKLEKIANKIQEASKNIAEVEIKRRKIINKEEFKLFIEDTENQYINDAYIQIKNILKSLETQKYTNTTLIKQKLFFTNKMINIIRPSKGLGIYNSYGKIGR